MKNHTIRIDNREPAMLTAELIYLGYHVENVLLLPNALLYSKSSHTRIRVKRKTPKQ